MNSGVSLDCVWHLHMLILCRVDSTEFIVFHFVLCWLEILYLNAIVWRNTGFLFQRAALKPEEFTV